MSRRKILADHLIDILLFCMNSVLPWLFCFLCGEKYAVTMLVVVEGR